MEPRTGAWWDALRIGIGPPLLKTDHGWLLIYHGVKETVGGAIYRIGLALLDLEDPTRVLRRTDCQAGWARAARPSYERQATCSNVAIFPCGLDPRPGKRRAAPLLRRRRQLDLPCDRTT